MKTETVQECLKNAFQIYGLPNCILCDNGSPWGSNWATRYTRLELWLFLHGVNVIHGRPYHPQTQGKEERFHRTLNVELIRRVDGFRNIAHCEKEFKTWRRIYNWERPHESLNMKTPSDLYVYSKRAFPDHLQIQRAGI